MRARRDLPTAPCAAFAGTLLLAATIHAQSPVAARRTSAPVTIDGVIDADEWRGAAETDAFVQRTPDLGGSAAHRTTARVLYDDRALYVAVACASSGAVEARLAQRDNIP